MKLSVTLMNSCNSKLGCWLLWGTWTWRATCCSARRSLWGLHSLRVRLLLTLILHIPHTLPPCIAILGIVPWISTPVANIWTWIAFAFATSYIVLLPTCFAFAIALGFSFVTRLPSCFDLDLPFDFPFCCPFCWDPFPLSFPPFLPPPWTRSTSMGIAALVSSEEKSKPAHFCWLLSHFKTCSRKSLKDVVSWIARFKCVRSWPLTHFKSIACWSWSGIVVPALRASSKASSNFNNCGCKGWFMENWGQLVSAAIKASPRPLVDGRSASTNCLSAS